MNEQQLIDFVSRIKTNETYIICGRCTSVCGLVRLLPTEYLLIRVKCDCGQAFTTTPEAVRLALYSLTPLHLTVALMRSYKDRRVAHHHAPKKLITYLSISRPLSKDVIQ